MTKTLTRKNNKVTATYVTTTTKHDLDELVADLLKIAPKIILRVQ